MIINYKKSESYEYPELVDTQSSKTTVYLRKNVVTVTETTEDGNEHTKYQYDEAKLTKKQYEDYLKELEILDIKQQRADIDYIALMTGVDLEEA